MDPLPLACDLISVPSVSSQSNRPVSDVVERALRDLGFEIERREFTDPAGVRQANVLGKKGPGRGGLAYFAHTDVVPVATWNFADGPFTPTIRDGRLYGRGSCDMKGSIAAFIAAAARIRTAELTAPLYVICTADEEIGYYGAKHVAAHSALYRELVAGNTRAMIGEPTELEVVYAHKGGCGFQAVSRGRASHTSTREGLNSNWAMIPFLQEMQAIHEETRRDPAWLNNEFDPPEISFNVFVSDHDPAINMTASETVCRVAFRPMPGQNVQKLIERARRAAEQQGLEFRVLWEESPLYTDPKSAFMTELLQLAGKDRPRTVAFGTDGSCFRDLKSVAVLGPGSVRQAHTDDEWIALEQLNAGTALYERLIRHWCTG